MTRQLLLVAMLVKKSTKMSSTASGFIKYFVSANKDNEKNIIKTALAAQNVELSKA